MSNHDARDDLILRHLDGETAREEAAQVTQLLAEDSGFRARFFAFVHQVARLRDMLTVPSEPIPEVVMAVASAKPQAVPVITTPQATTDERGGKIDYRQIYFNAVLGGIGGLLGWLAFALLNAIFQLRLNIYLLDVLQGLLFGVAIGFAIGSTEGIIASRSARRALRGAGIGALLGAIGGLIGVPLGEWFFNLAEGGVWPRAIGWAVFGAFIGTSDGFAQKMPSKIRYGILGGLLGGLIGGSTFDAMLRLARGGVTIEAWSKALGLIVLGACIGALVGLVESLLRTSFLFFITGRLEGQTRTLDSSRPHTLGSDTGCTIVLPGDDTVAPIHAEIVFAEEQFSVRPRDGKVIVRREGKDIPVKDSQLLQPGDRIHLGSTKMIFRNEAGKKKPQAVPTS